jgi:hypothetical protein
MTVGVRWLVKLESLAVEAGKSTESQRGDQDAGRAGNRCRVLDQVEEEALGSVDTYRIHRTMAARVTTAR